MSHLGDVKCSWWEIGRTKVPVRKTSVARRHKRRQSPPLFFQLSSTAGRAKELNPPTHQKRPASRTYIYNHFLGPIQSPLSLLSDRSVCVPPIYSFGSPTQEQLLLRHCNFIFSLFFHCQTEKGGIKRYVHTVGCYHWHWGQTQNNIIQLFFSIWKCVAHEYKMKSGLESDGNKPPVTISPILLFFSFLFSIYRPLKKRKRKNLTPSFDKSSTRRPHSFSRPIILREDRRREGGDSRIDHFLLSTAIIDLCACVYTLIFYLYIYIVFSLSERVKWNDGFSRFDSYAGPLLRIQKGQLCK